MPVRKKLYITTILSQFIILDIILQLKQNLYRYSEKKREKQEKNRKSKKEEYDISNWRSIVLATGGVVPAIRRHSTSQRGMSSARPYFLNDILIFLLIKISIINKFCGKFFLYMVF